MRIEGVQHAVARGVFDVSKVDVRPPETVLHERERVAQVRAHVPRRDDVIDPKLLLLGVDADAHLRGVVLLSRDDDLRHVLLHVVERRQQHLLRLDALGVDVPVSNGLQHLVDDLELGQVVGRGRVIHRDGVSRRDRRSEPPPEAVPVELGCQKRGDTHGPEQGEHLRKPFNNAHRPQV